MSRIHDMLVTETQPLRIAGIKDLYKLIPAALEAFEFGILCFPNAHVLTRKSEIGQSRLLDSAINQKSSYFVPRSINE